MPLGKKWRSMEVLNFGSRAMGPLESFLNSRNKSGSRENLRASASQSGSRESLNLDHNHNRHQPSQSRSLRSRLGSLSNNVREEQGSPKLKDTGAAGDTPAGYIQRCIIIQRDEKGYGFTVRGDNPVYVEVVKLDGAAAKAGVQQGDRIIKVNGTLVTNSNHLEVVKLIKAGSFVALTLLNKPAGGVNLRGPSKEIVSAPQSVNAHKSWELKQSKVLELHKYYELAVEELEKFKKGYQKCPTEKSHAQLLEKEKTVKTLRDQVEVIASTLPAEYSLPLSLGETSSPDTGSGEATPWLKGGPKHMKTGSTPVAVYASEELPADTRAGVSRSQSDAGSRNRDPVILKTGSRPGVSPERVMASTKRRMFNKIKKSSSLPSSAVDGGSFSDSPSHSPNASPTPTHPANSRLVEETTNVDDPTVNPSKADRPQQFIIAMEDDEFQSDEEHAQLSLERKTSQPVVSSFLARLQTLETDDHGPFNSLRQLDNKPAHTAIFLNFLLVENHDPSAFLFYVTVSLYNTAKGGLQDWKKWAYEIYSTFLVEGAPLRLNINEEIGLGVKVVLERLEQEEGMKALFLTAHQAVVDEIESQLTMFRQKKDMGMGNMFGAHEVRDSMKKREEMEVIEKYLLRHLEKTLTQTDTDIKNDREQAVCWALSTFLRYVGYNKHNSSLDKVPSFVCRDRKGIRHSSKPTKRPHRGHNFEPTHYIKVETCMYCKTVIWGVGYQGYLCKNCEQNIHTRCIERLEDNCKKKDKDNKRPLSNIFKGKGDIRKSVLPEIVLSGQTIKETEISGSPGPQVTTSFEIQPVKDEDDPDLHKIRSDPHSVSKLVNQFDQLVPSPSDKRRPQNQLSEPEMHRKGTDLGRSESLKGRADGRGDRPTRDRQRAKSDLDMDDAIKALHNNSGSSSTSSLSNRSVDSPSNSLDAVNNIPQSLQDDDSDYDVEQELPTLKSVLPEDVYRRLKPKERKRQDVINELVYTEKRHVRNLKIMESLFQKPMVQDPNISEEFTKLLFPNLDYMIQLHCALNNDLKAKRRENKVIDEVSEVLLKRFDNEEGEAFRKNCAIFCRNQQHALDMLRSKQKKDARISTFLGEAESSNLMRRLQLKDLIPTQMMRLTKYPLLIESLKKHTLLGSEEHTKLERALQCSKHILEYVNQAVQDYENIYRLEQLQRRMERKILTDYMAEELKTLDLRAHKLVHEGPLTWNMNQRKSLDVHVILLEDLFVLLQKQDDKLVLKCQSTQLVAGKEDGYKYMFAPVLKLNNILHTNSKATDKKAFFVVSKSQIYELSAHTADEQRKWCKYIKDAADAFKDKHIKATVTDVANAQPEVISQERDTLRVENRRTSGSSTGGEFMAEQVELSEEPGLIQPEDMVIKDAVTSKASPVLTPLDKLRVLDTDIMEKMKDRRALLKEILKLHEMDSTLRMQLNTDTDQPINDLLLDMAQESEDCINMLNSAESGLAKEDLSMPIPMDKLREMANRMNQILTNLLAVVNNRDDERERLRHELKAAQDELNMLREIQRRVSSSSPTDVTLNRPHSIISVASTVSDAAEDGTLTQVDSTDTDTEVTKEELVELQNVEPVNAMEMDFPEADSVSTATELPQEMVDIMADNLVVAEPPDYEAVDDRDPPALTEEEILPSGDSQDGAVHRVVEVVAEEITEIVEDLIQELPVVESNGDVTDGRRDSLEDYEDASDRLDTEGGAGRESGLEEDMVVSSDRGDNLTESSEKGDNLTESDVEMRDVEGEEVEKRDTERECNSDTDNKTTQSDHILSTTDHTVVDNRQLIDSSCVLDNKPDLDRLTVEGGAALEEMTVDI
ncbi:rho guanine nucleotide exchange factor 12-like isoform X4 [Mizuhopecten yessoensis]|uniref:rho guanine nucleotide exchange factor 12-like isoform X4 n=1 Tax=Mizuhopecten yessoensis TaxID=6573 RepID=UPI000B45E7F7|nr:rho guanine nucleotide exchange factor 12-like isoform X4 [Mizuhopecten yessoensis]